MGCAIYIRSDVLLCMCEEREERPKEHQKTREKGQQKTCHKMMMAQRCVKEKEKQARERERERVRERD